MENKILIVNPGSASKKYSFYVGDAEVLRAHFESENGGYVVNWIYEGKENEEYIDENNFKRSPNTILNKIKELGVINDSKDIDTIGFRTVAPGEYFLETHEINDEFMEQLFLAESRAPLHVAALISELREFSEVIPEANRYSISDSAFFKNRFEPSRYYGLPYGLAEELQIFRYGYHGISAASVVRKVSKIGEKLPSKMVICHLGSGVSLIGVKDGVGFDSSMGFTPLEGAMMSTRAGNLDAGALFYLMKNRPLSPDELSGLVNKKSGLLGLSDISDDMRILLQKEKEGDIGAKRAIDSFVYRIRKEIGSLVFAMGGIDILVFTATMGERSSFVRERVCLGLQSLGIELDDNKNNTTIGREGLISSEKSKIPVLVICSDEMFEMFLNVKDFLK